MFINEPEAARTVDRSRDAILEEASFAPDQTIIFLLTWHGRKIPFLARYSTIRDPVSTRSIIDWQVFSVGQTQILGSLQLPGCTFVDSADKASAADLIRDALNTYVIAFGQGPNVLGSIDIDLT
ncbi:MAG: hypothetical protein ACK515_04500 [bacterium]|jgi:hypothetical protein|nr:hypothetical protein [Betaproteobacteria bacterium]